MNWFRQNGYLIFPFLAFAIPLIVRTIPEILMGQYLVGFDTIGYYVPGTLEWLKTGIDFWTFIADAPLIYLLTIGVTSAGGSIVILIKILSPLLLGMLGLVVYFYALKTLSWSSKKSLLVAILSTLYFVALRISWDMLRCELGLIFLFLTLILLQKNGRSYKNGVLLSIVMTLVVLTNQLIAVILFAIVMVTIVRLYLDKARIELRNFFLCIAPSLFLFLVILYFNYFVYSLSVTGFSVRYSAGFNSFVGASHTDLIVNEVGFLAFCYLPMVPFLVFGARRFKSNLHIKTWIIWLFIPLLVVIFSPTGFLIGGVLPYRWILLLTYPLSFYAVEGVSAIKWNWFKLMVGFFLVILSVGFFVLPNSDPLGYFEHFTTYVPKSMLENTVQLSDCQDTSNALIWARNNMHANTYLLTHQAFYGWATLTLDIDRLIYYGFDDSLVTAQKYNNSSNTLYLIWWVNGTGWYGMQNVPDTFHELYRSGNIAVFNYTINT